MGLPLEFRSSLRLIRPNEARVNAAHAESQVTTGRLTSLDAFRGLTVVLMLLVNNAAMDTATPTQFQHAPWNSGFTLADLVMPWFLFCVGIAVPISLRSNIHKGGTTLRIAGRVLSRGFMLILIGWILDSAIAHHLVIDLGVLQIIGLAYIIAVALYSLPSTVRVLAPLVLLGLYGAFLQFTPVPGIGAPTLNEGQNIVKFLNDNYLVHWHLSGLISTIPTASLAVLGTLVGDLLLDQDRSMLHRLLLLSAWGLMLATLGWLWSMEVPFNKALWTPSYILVCAGLGTLLQACLFALFDFRNRGKWALPLVVMGTNALLAYIGPILVKELILETRHTFSGATFEAAWLGGFRQWFGVVGGGWVYTLSYVAIVWITLAFFYRKKWFLKV